jgi:hypothetical protein
MSNIILGTAVGYRIGAIMPFVLSLIKSGYKGRVVLFVEDLKSNLAEYLRKHSIEPCLYESSHIPVTNQRYILYKRFIEQEDGIGQIMLTDVRDVIFQGNPFTLCNTDNLYCFEEDKSMTLANCHYNSKWIRQAYGKNVLAQIGHNPIICSGVTIGNYNKVLQYLEILIKELAAVPPVWGIDQGVHNVLIRSEKVSHAVICPNECGSVYTMAYVKPGSVKVNKDGFIINESGMPCVIHQYDRHPLLKAAVQKKYITFLKRVDLSVYNIFRLFF